MARFLVSAATAAISIPLSLLSGLAGQALTSSILAKPVAPQIQTPHPAGAQADQDPLRIVLAGNDEADDGDRRTASPARLAQPAPTVTDTPSAWPLPVIVSAVGCSPVVVVLALPATRPRSAPRAADRGATAKPVPF